MKRDWRQWARDKGLEKWFRRDNLIVLVLAGILLFVIALPVKESGGEKDRTAAKEGATAENAPKGAEGADAYGQTPQPAGVEEEYAAYLERRLTEALSRMADVGEVKVMITLKVSRELVLEKDESARRSATEESDAQGGSRTVNETSSEKSTVYSSDGADSEPYVVKTYVPRIEGVLVVAEGAGTGTVNRTIVEIAGALFGVDAHKVIVVKMETD